MPQLSIQLAGADEWRVRVDRPCTLGDGRREEIAVAGLGEITLRLTPLAAGLVIESTAAFAVGRRRVRAGVPRLLRNGEGARVGDALLTAIGDPAPEGTRELAAAMLAGLDPAPVEGPQLLVLEGAGAGRRFPVGPRTLVGRSPHADVVLPDPLVSRRHVRLERCGDGLFARHLHSKNGLFVNGRRRRGRVPVRADDELRVGETLLVVEDPGSVAAPGPPSPTAPRPPRRSAEVIVVALASAALLAAALLLLRAG